MNTDIEYCDNSKCKICHICPLFIKTFPSYPIWINTKHCKISKNEKNT